MSALTLVFTRILQEAGAVSVSPALLWGTLNQVIKPKRATISDLESGGKTLLCSRFNALIFGMRSGAFTHLLFPWLPDQHGYI